MINFNTLKIKAAREKSIFNSEKLKILEIKGPQELFSKSQLVNLKH